VQQEALTERRRGSLLGKLKERLTPKTEQQKRNSRYGLVAGVAVATGGVSLLVMSAREGVKQVLAKYGGQELAKFVVPSAAAAGAVGVGMLGNFIARRGKAAAGERVSQAETASRTEFEAEKLQQLEDALMKASDAEVWWDRKRNVFVVGGAALGAAAGMALTGDFDTPDPEQFPVGFGADDVEVGTYAGTTSYDLIPRGDIGPVPEEVSAVEGGSETIAPVGATVAERIGATTAEQPEVAAGSVVTEGSVESPTPSDAGVEPVGGLKVEPVEAAEPPTVVAEPADVTPVMERLTPLQYDNLKAEPGNWFWNIMEGETDAPLAPFMERVALTDRNGVIDEFRDYLNAQPQEVRSEIGFGKTMSELPAGGEININKLYEEWATFAKEKGLLDNAPESSLRPEARLADLTATEQAPETSPRPEARPASHQSEIDGMLQEAGLADTPTEPSVSAAEGIGDVTTGLTERFGPTVAEAVERDYQARVTEGMSLAEQTNLLNAIAVEQSLLQSSDAITSDMMTGLIRPWDAMDYDNESLWQGGWSELRPFLQELKSASIMPETPNEGLSLRELFEQVVQNDRVEVGKNGLLIDMPGTELKRTIDFPTNSN
jgi:hypothetical protein